MTDPILIPLIDHYKVTPLELTKQLRRLDTFLADNAEKVYACTCEDYEPPRGSYEYDTDAYNHHEDCPCDSEYHWHVYLEGLAQYFDTLSKTD